MGLEELTPRSALLLLIGCVTTVLLIMGGMALWEHKFWPGSAYLAFGAGLTFIFFRRGKIAVVFIALAFILVNAGLTAVFRPTLPGILLSLGSAVVLILVARWQRRRTP